MTDLKVVSLTNCPWSGEIIPTDLAVLFS